MSSGTQAKPYGKLLDYEQFIDHQIQRTRARIKVTDTITACLTLLVGFLGVLFLEVVLDHVFGLPVVLRRVVFAAGMATACMFAALRSCETVDQANQRHLRREDDRRCGCCVQEQPDQLPRAAARCARRFRRRSWRRWKRGRWPTWRTSRLTPWSTSND